MTRRTATRALRTFSSGLACAGLGLFPACLVPELPDPTAAAPPSSFESMRIQAVGTLISYPQEGAGLAVAELYLVTTAVEPARALGGISDPRVITGDTESPLYTTETPGLFSTDSVRSPPLVYAPGEWVTFAFSVMTQEGEQKDFLGNVQTPVATGGVDLEPGLIRYAGEPVGIELWNWDEAAILRVIRLAPEPAWTWSSFAIPTPADVEGALSDLTGVIGPLESVPGSAFSVPGSYVIEVVNLSVSRPTDSELLSENHGEHSWYAAGIAQRLSVSVD